MTGAGTASGEAPDVCYLLVDEAGTPDIFDAKGRSKFGTAGYSHYIALGMVIWSNAPTILPLRVSGLTRISPQSPTNLRSVAINPRG